VAGCSCTATAQQSRDPANFLTAQADSDADPGVEQNGSAADDEPLPRIYYHDDALPAEVLKTRNALLLAARTGDPENLRPILEAGKVKTIVSFGGEEDPIAYWKASSIDGTARDILAEMIKIFSSGFVYISPGTSNAMYIWPYHFVYPLERLSAEQEVELYLLIPPEYREDMEAAGGYIGFRAGIDTDGSLVFFVAGH
jgi:hypothetical protein